MMSNDLEAIRERYDAATEPPWNFHLDDQECVRVTAEREGWVKECQPVDIVRVDIEFDDDIVDQDEANLKFIAHARTDIPRLWALVQALRAGLWALRSAVDETMGDSDLPEDDSKLYKAMVESSTLLAAIPKVS